MFRESFSLKNKSGLVLRGQVSSATEYPRGTIVFCHGYGQHRDTTLLQTCRQVWLRLNYQTVSFDFCNGYGQSDGSFFDFCLNSWYQDLNDLLVWLPTRAWWQRPLGLLGHSLGGFMSARWSAEHPAEAKFLVLISPVISGKSLFDAYRVHNPQELAEWQQKGYLVKKSSVTGKAKVHPWDHLEETLNHDLFPIAAQILSNTLLVVGDQDPLVLTGQVEHLYHRLTAVNNKKLIKMVGAGHNLAGTQYLNGLRRQIGLFVKKHENSF